MTLTVGSLFAGVGGFDLGLECSGWTTAWQVEIDDQARQVLRRHFPKAKRYDDVREVGSANLARVDLITGGFPCQDLSVAGRRAGLDGERSGLFFEFMRVVDEIAPRWVLIENVPGLLSSNEGRDMGTVLGTLADLGYGWSYRVLDTQYFGPPQRRRRVFIVGHLGGFCPPEILLEPESVPWNPAPSREAGEGITPLLEVGARTSGDGYRDGDGIGKPGDPLYTLQARHQHGVVPPVARSIGLGSDPLHAEDVAQPITNRNGDPGVVPPLDTTQITSKANYSRPKPGDPCHPLAAGAHAPSLAWAFNGDQSEKTRSMGESAEETPTLRSNGPVHTAGRTIPRRLTPKECERLQGFPDDWTAWGIDEDGERVEMADTPRYRMMGNAVSVSVAAWIGARIAKAHQQAEAQDDAA